MEHFAWLDCLRRQRPEAPPVTPTVHVRHPVLDSSVCEQTRILIVDEAAPPLVPASQHNTGVSIEDAETLAAFFSSINTRAQIPRMPAAYEEIRVPSVWVWCVFAFVWCVFEDGSGFGSVRFFGFVSPFFFGLTPILFLGNAETKQSGGPVGGHVRAAQGMACPDRAREMWRRWAYNGRRPLSARLNARCWRACPRCTGGRATMRVRCGVTWGMGKGMEWNGRRQHDTTRDKKGLMAGNSRHWGREAKRAGWADVR
ncbi:hypothetical protein K438DRAFT_1879371 [Mycena galopus ATCC 62051]|nr:hypothetical protein K438DRAFT_1879371 [Mycena galopus ATCC 62051]